MISSLGRYSKSISLYLTTMVGWGTFVTQSAPHAITSAEWMLAVAATAQFLLVLLVLNAEQSDPPPVKVPAKIVGGSVAAKSLPPTEGIA